MRKLALLAVIVGAGAVAVLPALAGTHAASVKVKMTEFAFAVSPKAVKKGVVTFRLENAGTLPHDFKINGKGSKVLDGGFTGSVKVTFKKKGKFRYLCTIPGHAEAGMKGTLVVK
jgi:uncharacterized cupredoxin-like copper-binding protein